MTAPAATRHCRCNGCLMLPQQINPSITSYWCPHMDKPGQLDVQKRIAWQELNKVPDFLCKVKLVDSGNLP